MKKRILSIILIFACVVTWLPFMPLMTAEAVGMPANYGQFRVNLNADPATQIPVGGGDGFGTEASAGRIWTDKSVGINSDGSFGVTLSALGQEYMTTYSENPGLGGSGSADALAADVTFILDMSTSMQGNDIPEVEGSTTRLTRVNAMTQAANRAIKIVMDANANNRVAVHWFGGPKNSTHVGTFMAMGQYTPKTGTDYLVNSGNSIRTNVNQISTNISNSLAAGTPTQNGIRYGVSKAIADIKAIADPSGVRQTGPQRKPYVFILSDGAASIGQAAWKTLPDNSTTASSYTNIGELTGGTATGSKEVAAATILTGMYMKNELDKAYYKYNNNNPDLRLKAKFYTVGLGPDDAINGPTTSANPPAGQPVYAWAGLDPKTVFNNRTDNTFRNGTAKNTHDQIYSYAHGVDSSYEMNYIYSDYYKWAAYNDELGGAFTELSSDVAAATTILPLLNLPVGGSLGNADAGSAISIVDEIGAGFTVDVSTLKIGDTAAVVDGSLSVTGGTAYAFAGYGSKAVIKTVAGVTTLTWYIAADDMQPHIYRFSSRTNPQPGEYTAPTYGAFKLNYNVKPSFTTAPDTVIDETYFLNAGSLAEGAKTAAYFSPPDDSPYYTALTSPKIISKTAGIGAGYVSEESLAGDILTMKLGNNGRLDLEMGIIKTGPAAVQTNGTITYTVTVYNYTDADKTGLTVTSDGQTQNGVNVPANESTELTFTVTAPATPTTVTSDRAQISGGGPQSNTVETAVTDIPEYTIGAEVGAVDGGSVTGGGTYDEDELVTLTAAPDEGYEFVGWYDNGSGTGSALSGEETYTFLAEGNGTYYAIFQRIIYSVTVTAGPGGSVIGTGSGTYEYGTTVTVTAVADDVYAFGGFTMTPVGIGNVSGNVLTIGSLTCDVTIAANFLAPGEITFNYNGATGGNTETGRTVTEGSTLGALPQPTRTGYTFGGWQDGSGNAITADTVMPAEGIAAVAVWTPIPYTVILNHNGGSGDASITRDYNTQITAAPPSVRDGYTFAGWYSDSDLTGNMEFPFIVTGNAVWYARWVEIIPPVAVDDSYYVTEGRTLTVNAPGILANDTGTDGDPLTAAEISAISDPSKGTLTPNADGSFTFAARTPGTVTFTYKAYDGTAYSNTATVTIHIASDDWEPAPPPTPAPPPPPSPAPAPGTVVYRSAEPDILLKTAEGEAKPFIDYSRLTVELPGGNGNGGQTPAVTVDPSGNVEMENLQKDNHYNFDIYFELVPGVKVVVGHLKVNVDGNGEVAVEKTLIDPYGTLTDTVSGEVVPGAYIELHYADTPRNRGNGTIPDALADLPKLAGFEPNDNANPQYSDAEGKYAYMVYPFTDYYILVKLPGFKDFRSPVIPVEAEIVKFDIAFEPSEIRDPAVFLKSGKNKIQEKSNVEISLDYFNKNITDCENASLSLVLPEGFSAVSAEGAEISGQRITWNLGTLKSGEKGSRNLTLQTPEINEGERIFNLEAAITADGKLYFKEDDTSRLPLLVYSNRYTILHKRYIMGYPDFTFKPERGVTRAEVAAIFARIMDLESTVTGETLYKDVDGTHWAAKYIEAISKKDLFTGYNDGSFRPDQAITREELSTVAARFLGVERSSKTPLITAHFGDIGQSFARNSIEELYRLGVIQGYGDKSFKPDSPINRAEAISIINRMRLRGALTGMENTFPDMDEKEWAFEDAEEAIRTHESQWMDDGREKMIRYIEEPLW